MKQTTKIDKRAVKAMAKRLIDLDMKGDDSSINDIISSIVSCDEYIAICKAIYQEEVYYLVDYLLDKGVEQEVINEGSVAQFYAEYGQYKQAVQWLLKGSEADIDFWLFDIEDNQTKLQATMDCKEFDAYIWEYMGDIPDGHEISDIDRYTLLLPFAKYSCMANNLELLEQILFSFLCWNKGEYIDEIADLAISHKLTSVKELLETTILDSKDDDLNYILSKILIANDKREEALPYLEYASKNKGKWKNVAKALLSEIYPEKFPQSNKPKSKVSKPKKKSIKARLYHFFKSLFG